ncbi:MAG: hypothetical protein D3924_13145, partial [Candidatus Electrothrix sp. AR4]|nr:hypothetical protein [Candidatus Electrothrix sp. AR4]
MNMKICQYNQLFDKMHFSVKCFRRFYLIVATLLFALLVASGGIAGEENTSSVKEKIVILPFTVQTSGSQTHLRTGLTNILATRMTHRTGFVAIQRKTRMDELASLLRRGDKQEAVKILKEAEGAYLLIGSLEEQELGYEIVVHVFNRQNKVPASFSTTFSSLSRALSAVDELSLDIAEKIFDRPRVEKQLSLIADSDGMAGFQTAHPDRAYKTGLYREGADEVPSRRT